MSDEIHIADIHLDNITYRKIDYWCRNGIIGGGTPGSGNYRTFTELDVKRLQVLDRLSPYLLTSNAKRLGSRGRENSVDMIPLDWVQAIWQALDAPVWPNWLFLWRTVGALDRWFASTVRPNVPVFIRLDTRLPEEP